MFGRLAVVRIKAAEDALAGGRLEAAFETLVGSELSDDRRVKRLRSDLAEAFLQRGQDHMLGKRFDTASRDFDCAGRCGGAVAGARGFAGGRGGVGDAERG